MAESPANDWIEYRRLVLSEIERIDHGAQALDHAHDELHSEFIRLQGEQSRYEKKISEFSDEQDIVKRRLVEIERDLVTIKSKATMFGAGTGAGAAGGLWALYQLLEPFFR